MKLTDNEIRETIAKMRAPRKVRDALLKQALSGDPHARFSVLALRKRQC